MPRLERRETKAPGPRTQVTLDVAEVGLAEMVKGLATTRCWLTEEGDGVYTFHANQTVGQSREQAGKPAPDLLVELMNELGDALEADDVPSRLRDLWCDLLDRYQAETAPPSRAEAA